MATREGTPETKRFSRLFGSTAEINEVVRTLRKDLGISSDLGRLLTHSDKRELGFRWRQVCREHSVISVMTPLLWAWLSMATASLFGWAFASVGAVASGLPRELVTLWGEDFTRLVWGIVLIGALFSVVFALLAVRGRRSAAFAKDAHALIRQRLSEARPPGSYGPDEF